MGIKKKMLALVLVAALGISSALGVCAASSPSEGIVPTTDVNTKDHNKKTVTTNVTETNGTVTKVASDKKHPNVEFEIARDGNDKKVNITIIGDGKKGVFNSKKGRYIKKVSIKSAADKVIVKRVAFKGSKVGKLVITSSLVQFDKNAFKGTKQKKLTMKVSKASQLSLKKGAFNGLTKITVKGASKAEFKKIKKAMKKAGFKGTIKKG